MWITVVLLLILRGFNWEHSISCTIHKLTDLFCLTILLAKFNILASFILHFLATHWPILSYNPFCQIQYFTKFYSALSCNSLTYFVLQSLLPNSIFYQVLFCTFLQLTDLFCLTIPFVKFNILPSFILHFLANIEG